MQGPTLLGTALGSIEVAEPQDLLPPVLLQQRQQMHPFVPRPLVLNNKSGWEKKCWKAEPMDATAGMAASRRTGSRKLQVISLSLPPPAPPHTPTSLCQCSFSQMKLESTRSGGRPQPWVRQASVHSDGLLVRGRPSAELRVSCLA